MSGYEIFEIYQCECFMCDIAMTLQVAKGSPPWLMQNVCHQPQIAHEFEIRIRSLREGTARRWSPF